MQNALLYNNNNIQIEYIICIYHFWNTTKKNYEILGTGLHDRYIAQGMSQIIGLIKQRLLYYNII